MTGHTRASRSAATCHFKCGDACLRDEGSASTSPSFAAVAEAAISRRTLLSGLGAAVLVVGTTSSLTNAPGAAAATVGPATVSGGGRLVFEAIAPVDAAVDSFAVPHGYRWDVIISWGDPVVPGAPPFDLDHQSAAAQEMQFGYNCDYLAILPGLDGTALLVANHEYTNENLMVPGFTDEESMSPEQLRTSIAAHGMSVVAVRRGSRNGPWEVAPSPWGRRITGLSTEFHVTGPAAGCDLLRTSADPGGSSVIGTLNNCAGGTTPWGTVLSGEENFDQYFRGDPDGDPRNRDTYGLVDADGQAGDGRFWWRVDPRFDVREEPNEVNRFGWVVEVDPYDPASTPRKHTALGRFKHEGATTSPTKDGRLAVYMGDDTADQHLYKFVSATEPSRAAGWWGKGSPSQGLRDRNAGVLESGDLYVARFAADGDPAATYDGTGEWLPLTRAGTSAVPGMSHEEVLVFTRDAAAAVGATPMDRPEDVERNPVNGKVYVALSNNKTRAAPGPANPRATNKFGQVLEVTEADDDAAATTFTWSLVLVCGDPEDPSTYFSGYPREKVSPISCPDNVTFDADGGLWVATDGAGGSIGYNDGLHHVGLEGEQRGRVSQFLSVPVGAETCGPWVDSASGSVLVNVQHPGETDDASVEAPASAFPYDGKTRAPRPSVVQVWRP